MRGTGDAHGYFSNAGQAWLKEEAWPDGQEEEHLFLIILKWRRVFQTVQQALREFTVGLPKSVQSVSQLLLVFLSIWIEKEGHLEKRSLRRGPSCGLQIVGKRRCLGWHVCRTKLTRKSLNSKRNVAQKTRKMIRNVPENCLSPVRLSKNVSPAHCFHSENLQAWPR